MTCDYCDRYTDPLFRIGDQEICIMCIEREIRERVVSDDYEGIIDFMRGLFVEATASDLPEIVTAFLEANL